MHHAATATEILDREFLPIRGKLLEVAAALDRIERGADPVASDPRLEKIRETLGLLGRQGAKRAEELQMLFSLPYEPKWRKL
jgi:hypothetical protein